ncbi:MAG TPA: glutamate racemase [Myxococcaceae bacterium]|nr:glutamate racemase [Myxococcaceae bacterium]
MESDRQRPIGVFDSGLGGLTVLKALEAQLPRESTIYLGDTARVPYGSKSAAAVTRFSLRNAAFLREQGIKLLVVACNTASATALETLQAELDIPVLGVIEPGAAAAVAQAPEGGTVAVIGTTATIRSGAYQRALEALRPGGRVEVQACPLFVPLAEEGWLEGPVPEQIAERYLSGFRDGQPRTLVLGCTHYPLLSKVIRATVGPRVQLVDAAAATAEATRALLASRGLLADGDATPASRFYVTDVPGRFSELGGAFLGRAIPHVEQVTVEGD